LTFFQIIFFISCTKSKKNGLPSEIWSFEVLFFPQLWDVESCHRNHVERWSEKQHYNDSSGNKNLEEYLFFSSTAARRLATFFCVLQYLDPQVNLLLHSGAPIRAWILFPTCRIDYTQTETQFVVVAEILISIKGVVETFKKRFQFQEVKISLLRTFSINKKSLWKPLGWLFSTSKNLSTTNFKRLNIKQILIRNPDSIKTASKFVILILSLPTFFFAHLANVFNLLRLFLTTICFFCKAAFLSKPVWNERGPFGVTNWIKVEEATTGKGRKYFFISLFLF